MNEQPPVYQKQLRFFRINPVRKQDLKQLKDKSLSFIDIESRKVHEIIRQVIKDFQYFSSHQKQELNLSEGERVLRMNGIKIIKENGSYFIQKYSTKQDPLKKAQKILQKGPQKTDMIRVQFVRSESLSDPRYLLSMLGYTTKETNYFKYMETECYKCPGYGIEIVIYQKWDESQFMMIDSVLNYEGVNVVSNILVEKLQAFVTEESIFNIDSYTLRPKGLKHGVKPEE